MNISARNPFDHNKTNCNETRPEFHRRKKYSNRVFFFLYADRNFKYASDISRSNNINSSLSIVFTWGTNRKLCFILLRKLTFLTFAICNNLRLRIMWDYLMAVVNVYYVLILCRYSFTLIIPESI